MTEEKMTMTTPGKLLRAAREALRLSPSEVAEKLRLSTRVIHDIEKDDYQRFQAMIYLKGYLRSYAQLVNIPFDSVEAALNQMDNLPKRDVEPIYRATTSDVLVSKSYSRRHLGRWISVGIFTLLIVLVAMWWHGQQTHDYSTVSGLPPVEVTTQDQTQTAANAEQSPAAPAAAATVAETPKPAVKHKLAKPKPHVEHAKQEKSKAVSNLTFQVSPKAKTTYTVSKSD